MKTVDGASLEGFVRKFDGFSSWGGKKQTDYFVYFLTSNDQTKGVTPRQVIQCFQQLDLKAYARIPQYLSEQARESNKYGKYIRTSHGYRLQRERFAEIDQQVRNEPKRIQASQQLEGLAVKIIDLNEKAFLEEAINCYKIQAFRATIVMSWILTMYHLQKYIFDNKLSDFNAALAKSPDKRVKKITKYDEFSDLKESKVIELMRSAGIISNDVRKILDEKLGIRNTAGHPSGVVVGGHKTTEFILDLVNNVVTKY